MGFVNFMARPTQHPLGLSLSYEISDTAYGLSPGDRMGHLMG